MEVGKNKRRSPSEGVPSNCLASYFILFNSFTVITKKQVLLKQLAGRGGRESSEGVPAAGRQRRRRTERGGVCLWCSQGLDCIYNSALGNFSISFISRMQHWRLSSVGMPLAELKTSSTAVYSLKFDSTIQKQYKNNLKLLALSYQKSWDTA